MIQNVPLRLLLKVMISNFKISFSVMKHKKTCSAIFLMLILISVAYMLEGPHQEVCQFVHTLLMDCFGTISVCRL